jgi:nucleotidyltransferase substrate binding protein (TIGR01987 family)
MNPLYTDHLDHCISTLERAFRTLQQLSLDDEVYDIYRAACVKEFEIILEQTGKLLKKCLKTYFSNPKQVDTLNFKDIFRYAAKHGLLEFDEAERWLRYRDNRNDTAHDYGVGFADETLILLPQFIHDARRLYNLLSSCHE